MHSSKLFRIVMAFLAMIAVSFGSFASENQPQSVTPISTEVVTTEYFIAKKGFTLWATFVAEKRPRKGWPKYWQDACVLSQIPCTDVAWRNIQVGQKITITPRSPEKLLAAEHASLMDSEPIVDAKTSEMLIAQKKLLDAQETLTALKFRSVLTTVSFIILAICLLLLCGLLFARIYTLRRQNARMRTTLDREFPVLPMSNAIDTSRLLLPRGLGDFPMDTAQDVDFRPAAERGQDDILACRSIELTCEYDGLFKTATDKDGLRYKIDDRTKGQKEDLRPGDTFYADVTSSRRVVTILTTTRAVHSP